MCVHHHLKENGHSHLYVKEKKIDDSTTLRFCDTVFFCKRVKGFILISSILPQNRNAVFIWSAEKRFIFVEQINVIFTRPLYEAVILCDCIINRNIARADRQCTLCNLHDIKDEYHFIPVFPIDNY